MVVFTLHGFLSHAKHAKHDLILSVILDGQHPAPVDSDEKKKTMHCNVFTMPTC